MLVERRWRSPEFAALLEEAGGTGPLLLTDLPDNVQLFKARVVNHPKSSLAQCAPPSQSLGDRGPDRLGDDVGIAGAIDAHNRAQLRCRAQDPLVGPADSPL